MNKNIFPNLLVSCKRGVLEFEEYLSSPGVKRSIENLEISNVVDPNDQEDTIINISKRAKEIYLFLNVSVEFKNQLISFLDYNKEEDKKNDGYKYYFDHNVISGSLEERLHFENKATNNEIDIIHIPDNLFNECFKKQKKSKFKKIKDRNAWTSGPVTYGSTGTYLTIKDLANDSGTFTADGEATCVSVITSAPGVSYPTFGNNVGGFTMTINNDGYLYNTQYSSHGIRFNCVNGKTVIKNFKIKKLVASDTAIQGVFFFSASCSTDVDFHNNFIDQDSKFGSSVRIDPATPVFQFWNNIMCNVTGTACYAARFTTGSMNTNNKIASDTFYNCRVGVDFNSNDFSVVNLAAYDCADGCFLNAGSLSQFQACYSTDTTGTTGSRVAATDFESLVVTDSNFLVPTTISGGLYENNVATIISGHTKLYNDTDINSVGANGVPAASGSSSFGITSSISI